VRLEKIDPENDSCKLVMSPKEWKDVHSLATFAHAGLVYDGEAAYVAQVFTYLYLVGQFGVGPSAFSQPKDILADEGMQAAFAAVDRLAARTLPESGTGEAVLALSKHEMQELLHVLGKATEAEDQAEIIHGAFPEKFPHLYPELELATAYYADAFCALLQELRADEG
jgi:hypothetical protein